MKLTRKGLWIGVWLNALGTGLNFLVGLILVLEHQPGGALFLGLSITNAFIALICAHLYDKLEDVNDGF